MIELIIVGVAYIAISNKLLPLLYVLQQLLKQDNIITSIFIK